MIRFKVIAFDGNLTGLNYVVPENEVEGFLAKFNDHGHWVVMGSEYNHLAIWSSDIVNNVQRRI